MKAEQIIERIVNELKNVRGIEAIVLGGSRAVGSNTEKSDIDIGIYYNNPEVLDLENLEKIAAALDDEHRTDLITEIEGWGPWINGGGWLHIEGLATDFLFRDINKVDKVINDCLNGIVTIDYQPGHPHGFINAIYVGETFYAKVLYDPNHQLSQLKEKITPYPVVLKEAMIKKFLWEAAFSLLNGRKGIYKQDLVYATGCAYRSVSCLLQVLFALNDRYCMNEKGAMNTARSFSILPIDFNKRIDDIFSTMTSTPESLHAAYDELFRITKEIEDIHC